MVYLGLFHPCEQRANISDIDQDKELALVLLWQTPIFSLPSAYQSSRSAHSYLRPAAALRELKTDHSPGRLSQGLHNSWLFYVLEPQLRTLSKHPAVSQSRKGAGMISLSLSLSP